MDGMLWVCAAAAAVAGTGWFLVQTLLRGRRSAPEGRRRGDAMERLSTSPGTAFGRLSTIR